MTTKHFEKQYSSNVFENYDNYFVPAIGKPLAKDLINKAHLHQGDNVLDVACGTGVLTRLAAKEVGTMGNVEGLDINSGMLNVARSASQADKNISWLEASADSIPLPDGSFDVVMCQLGLQFVENKSAALKEIHRVLAPNGKLVINLPGPIAPAFEDMDKAIKKHISPEAAKFVEIVFSLYDPKEIRELLTVAGFHDVDVQQKVHSLKLPPPKDFLLQYVSSTPLSAVIDTNDEKKYAVLENEIINKWQKYIDNGGMKLEQNIVIAIAKKKA